MMLALEYMTQIKGARAVTIVNFYYQSLIVIYMNLLDLLSYVGTLFIKSH